MQSFIFYLISIAIFNGFERPADVESGFASDIASIILRVIAVIIPLALLKTVSTFIFYIRWDSFTLAFLFFIILLFS